MKRGKHSLPGGQTRGLARGGLRGFMTSGMRNIRTPFPLRGGSGLLAIDAFTYVDQDDPTADKSAETNPYWQKYTDLGGGVPAGDRWAFAFFPEPITVTCFAMFTNFGLSRIGQEGVGVVDNYENHSITAQGGYEVYGVTDFADLLPDTLNWNNRTTPTLTSKLGESTMAVNGGTNEFLNAADASRYIQAIAGKTSGSPVTIAGLCIKPSTPSGIGVSYAYVQGWITVGNVLLAYQ